MLSQGSHLVPLPAAVLLSTGTTCSPAKLSRQGIGYQTRENAFLQIDDWSKAQSLSDSIRAEELHQVLDILASRYVPFLQKYGLSYRWSIMQAEYATDIVFKRQADLEPIYDNLVRTAVFSVKPENIATFLGQKQLHGNYQGEMGNNFNTRILGTRIKHQMGAVSIKMYDKFGIVAADRDDHQRRLPVPALPRGSTA